MHERAVQLVRTLPDVVPLRSSASLQHVEAQSRKAGKGHAVIILDGG